MSSRYCRKVRLPFGRRSTKGAKTKPVKSRWVSPWANWTAGCSSGSPSIPKISMPDRAIDTTDINKIASIDSQGCS